MSRIAYVNGRYLPLAAASVNVEDRGYQFSDGVYEVCEVRGGRLVDERRHMTRLQFSLSELRIAHADDACRARRRAARGRSPQPRALGHRLSADHPRRVAPRPCLSAGRHRAEHRRHRPQSRPRRRREDGRRRRRRHLGAGQPLGARRHQVGVAAAQRAGQAGGARAGRPRGLVRRRATAASPKAPRRTPGS